MRFALALSHGAGHFFILNLDPDARIRFLAVVPIYDDELNFKLQFGVEELLERFEAAELTDVIDPQRPSVLQRKKL